MYSKKIYTSLKNRTPTSWNKNKYICEERQCAGLSLGYIQHLDVRKWLGLEAAKTSSEDRTPPPRGEASQHLKAEAESGIHDALQPPWRFS